MEAVGGWAGREGRQLQSTTEQSHTKNSSSFSYLRLAIHSNGQQLHLAMKGAL